MGTGAHRQASLSHVMSPEHDRPQLPAGYGGETAEKHLAWEEIESKLRESLHYWISTTRPDSRPHAIPRWGVWLDSRFWYDGSLETVHARNLGTAGPCVLHLESGTDTVIVEGISTAAKPITGDMGERLAAEYARKYSPAYTPEPGSWSDAHAGGMRIIEPTKVIAWSDFPKDVTRFKF